MAGRQLMFAMMFMSVMMLACGCGPRKSAPTRTPMAASTEPAAMSDLERHVGELKQRAAALRKAADVLPARDVRDDARYTMEAFDASMAALNTLAGPDPAGFFRQQLRAMKEERDQIVRATDPSGAAPEPVVDSGLRAMYNAIDGIRQAQFPANTDVAEHLTQLRNRLGELDAVRGPLHRLVAAEAFGSMASAVEKMADVYEKQESTTQPAAK